MKSQRTGVFKALPKEAVNLFNPQISQSQGHTPFFLEVPCPVLVPPFFSASTHLTGGVPNMQGPLSHLASWVLQFLFSPVCFSPENLRVGRGLFSPQRCEQAEGEEVVADALEGSVEML